MKEKSNAELIKENDELRKEIRKLNAAIEQEQCYRDKILFILKENKLLLFTGELDGIGANWQSNDSFFREVTGIKLPDVPELSYNNMRRIIHPNDLTLLKEQLKFIRKGKGNEFFDDTVYCTLPKLSKLKQVFSYQ